MPGNAATYSHGFRKSALRSSRVTLQRRDAPFLVSTKDLVVKPEVAAKVLESIEPPSELLGPIHLLTESSQAHGDTTSISGKRKSVLVKQGADSPCLQKTVQRPVTARQQQDPYGLSMRTARPKQTMSFKDLHPDDQLDIFERSENSYGLKLKKERGS